MEDKRVIMEAMVKAYAYRDRPEYLKCPHRVIGEVESVVENALDKLNDLYQEPAQRRELVEELDKLGVKIAICSHCGKLIASGYVVGESAIYHSIECMEAGGTSFEEFEDRYSDRDNQDCYHEIFY